MDNLNILIVGGKAPWLAGAGGGDVIDFKLAEAIAKSRHNVDFLAVAQLLYRFIEETFI